MSAPQVSDDGPGDWGVAIATGAAAKKSAIETPIFDLVSMVVFSCAAEICALGFREPFSADLRAPTGRTISGHVCRGDWKTANLIPGSQRFDFHIPSNEFYASHGNKIPLTPIQ
jgi:hypothetical protein